MEMDYKQNTKHFIPDLLETLEVTQDDSKLINALQIFHKKAKRFLSQKQTEDVVQEFLDYPGSCLKLTSLLSVTSLSAEKVTWIFNALHCILLRINDDLSKYENTVQDIVHQLVQDELRAFCSLLEKGQQHQGAKAALQLLTSIVMMGLQHAKAIAAQFGIFTDNLSRLSNMRKFEDASDIRTCVVHFVMSFLIMDISSIVRQVCDQKGVLNAIIIGLPYDKASLIRPFLLTIKSKILENPSVSKTQKIRILNERSLMSIFNLLSWKGPKTLSNQKLLRKVTEAKETWVQQDASEEEVEIVQLVAFEFLKVACTSRKLGIVLSEDPLQQGRNPNYTIFKVLLTQQSLFDDSRKRELVAEILCTCPSQIHYFLSNVKSLFEPRNSITWFHAMTFITKVASLQKVESFLRECHAQQDIFPVVKKIQTVLGMLVLQKNYIFKALRSKDIFLILVMTEWLSTVLGKVHSIHLLKSSHPEWNINSICNELLRFLPSLSDILPIFLEDANFQESFSQCTVPEGVKITMVDYLNKMIDVLVLCCELGASNLESELPGSFPRLLSFIKQHASSVDEASLMYMHLKVLKLISPDPTVLHLWQGKLEEECKPLFMMFDLYVRVPEAEASKTIKQLILKLFSSFEAFQGYEWEIDLWLQELQTLTPKKRKNAINLLCHTVQVFLCSPNQYIDSVMECCLEAMGKTLPDKTVNNNLSNEVFLGCLGKQLDLSSDFKGKTFRSFFTPLVPAAITASSEHSGSRNYMEAVLLKILHQQHEPEALCILLQRSGDVLSQFLQNYIYFWHPDQAGSRKNFWTMQTFWQKYMNEERSSEPATLHLISAFILFQLEAKSTHVDHLSNVYLVMSKAVPKSKLEATELLSQSLLYLQTQLKSLTSEAVSSNVSVLCTYIDKLIICMCNSLDHGSDKMELLGRTLSHPVFKKWFITPGDEELTTLENENVQHCSHLLTDLTSKYLCFATQTEPDIKKLESSFGLFKCKLLSATKSLCPTESWNIQPLWVNYIQGVVGCLGMLTASEVAQILNTLLTIPLTNLKLLKDVSCVIRVLIEKFMENERKPDTVYWDTNTVKVFFEMVCDISEHNVIGRENLMKCLVTFLEQNPMFCNIASPACFDCLLVECGAVNLSLVKLLCKYNPSHCIRLRKFLNKHLHSVRLWPPVLCLQILELVYSLHHPKPDEEQLLEGLSEVYMQFLSTLMIKWECSEDCEDVLASFSVLKMLLQRNENEKSSLALIIDRVLERSMSCQAVPSMNSLYLINQVFEIFQTICPAYKVSGLTPRASLLRLHLHWITVLLSQPSSNNLLLLDFISETLSVIQNSVKKEISDAMLDLTSWYHFVTTLLRKALRCNTTGPVQINVLTELCKVVYSDQQTSISPSCTELLQLVLGHSSFGTIMLQEESTLNMLEEPVIDLWTTLATLNSSCCQSEHFPILLGAYRASLTPTDQKLFHLMSLYEENDISMHGFRPFVWGPSAISYFSSQAKSRLSLWKQPKLEDILHLLEKEKMIRTCIHGPLDLKLKPTQIPTLTEAKVHEDEGSNEDLSSVYDGRFLLLVLNHLVQLGSVVDCEKFNSSQCLAFVLSTLSYQDEDLRALGYQVLSLFYQHLEVKYSHYNKTWVFILSALRNALKTPNVRLPSLITNFLGKATSILSKPNDHLYTVIYKFLALKPTLDTGNVPEFYELFYSSDINHIHHRTFLLSLLQEGMRTSLDFHLSQKRFVFPIILSYCTSALCRPQTKILILEILRSALRIRSAALILCRTQSLMAWIQSFISNHIVEKHKQKTVSCLVRILQTLWHTSKTQKVLKSRNVHKLTVEARTEEPVDDDDDDGEESEEVDGVEECDVEMSDPKDTFASESNEPVVTKSAMESGNGARGHPFYPSFPNEFLLVCLSLLDAVRKHKEIAEPCSEMSESVDILPYTPPTAKKIIKLAKVCQEIWLEDQITFLKTYIR